MGGALSQHLTLDLAKKEARDLLHGLERKDPTALRRYYVVDPFTDMSYPALDDARYVIANEHGFSSWRKLTEHLDTPE